MSKNNECKPVVGTVQVFKLKPISVEAIQFTGKNGKEVAKFANERGQSGRAGGSWVKIVTDSRGETMVKGDILVWSFSELTVYKPDEFKAVHSVGKNNSLLDI